MKFTTLLILVSTVFTLNSVKAHSGEIKEDPLVRLNSSYQTLLKATNIQDLTHDIRHLWDLLNPVVRFVLLNQTQISSLPFNVTIQLQTDVNNLNWTYLPTNVQSVLLAQTPSMLINLSFLNWGFVDSANSFADSTVNSLLPTTVQNSLASVYILLAPLSFDLQVDLTALNQTLQATTTASYNHRQHGVTVRRFLESFFESFERLLPEGRHRRFPSRFPIKKQPTASSTFSEAMSRAERFIRSLNIKNCY